MQKKTSSWVSNQVKLASAATEKGLKLEILESTKTGILLSVSRKERCFVIAYADCRFSDAAVHLKIFKRKKKTWQSKHV